MTISSDIIFIKSDNKYDAFSVLNMNENIFEIKIGLGMFTLETMIHEINEIEITVLLKSLGIAGDATIHNKESKENVLDYVSHVLSPYGRDSFIDPCHYVYEDIIEGKRKLSEYEEVLL